MLHNDRVYVRPLKHCASRRLGQTIRSAQTGHQLLLRKARRLSRAVADTFLETGTINERHDHETHNHQRTLPPACCNSLWGHDRNSGGQSINETHPPTEP
jgi:hypothetical protein